MRTFVRVHHIVLNYHIPTINGIVLLGLAPHFTQIGRRVLAPASSSCRPGPPAASGGFCWVRYAQDMASEEFFGGNGLRGAGAGGGFSVAGGEQYIGGGDQEDVVLNRTALRGQGALEEGGEEWV